MTNFRQHSTLPGLSQQPLSLSLSLCFSLISGFFPLMISYCPQTGDQVYLPDDVQVRKAIESLDKARLIADNARRARGDRQ